MRPYIPVKGVSMILGNNIAGDRVIGDPQVSDVPCLATENEAIEDLFFSCTVTRAMAKAAEVSQENSAQEESSNITPENESLESKATHKSRGSLQPLGLSPSKLVTEQEQDMEILSIKKRALSEIEAEKASVCYFV